MKLKLHFNNNLVITSFHGRQRLTSRQGLLDKTIDFLRSKGRVATINGDDGKLFMERCYLLFKDRTNRSSETPRKLPFNILLHKICRSDPDGYHDHPWPFISIIIKGHYDEYFEGKADAKHRGRFSFAIRNTQSRHRIELSPGESVYTIIIRGSRIKNTFSKTNQINQN